MKEKNSSYPYKALCESILKDIILYVEHHRPDTANKLREILKSEPLPKISKKDSEHYYIVQLPEDEATEVQHLLYDAEIYSDSGDEVRQCGRLVEAWRPISGDLLSTDT